MNTPERRILERRLIESRLTLERQARPPEETTCDHPSAEAVWDLEKLWRRLAALQTREIDAALLKIHQGEFGICERCRQPISQQRLEAIPWARQCFPCLSRQAERTFARNAFRLPQSLWRVFS